MNKVTSFYGCTCSFLYVCCCFSLRNALKTKQKKPLKIPETVQKQNKRTKKSLTHVGKKSPCFCCCYSFRFKQTLHSHHKVNSNSSIHNCRTNGGRTRKCTNLPHLTGIYTTFELKQHKFLHKKIGFSLNLQFACALDAIEIPHDAIKVDLYRFCTLVYPSSSTHSKYHNKKTTINLDTATQRSKMT